MKFDINLASRPAENLRRVWIIWGGLLGLCSAVLLVMTLATVAGYLADRRAARELSKYRADIMTLQLQETRQEARLRQPEAADVIERAQYLNRLFDRKTVSWTHLFERLEAVMPARAKLVSLGSGDRQSGNAVTIVVASESVQPLIEFARQLEAAPDFTRTMVSGERRQEGDSEATSPLYYMAVTARYAPTTGDIASPKQTQMKAEPLTPEDAAEAAADASGADGTAPDTTAHDSATGQNGARRAQRGAAPHRVQPGVGAPRVVPMPARPVKNGVQH
jgi:type IV pilus assembly protein PilN